MQMVHLVGLALALACAGDKDGDDDGGGTDGGGSDGGGSDGGTDGGGSDGGGSDGGGSDGGTDGGGSDGGAGEGLDWDPTGRVYRADPASGTWHGPTSGMGVLEMWGDGDLLVKVLGVDGALSLRLGWTDAPGLAQEPCLATGETSAPPLPLPAFEASPLDLELMAQGLPVPLQEVVVSGTFGDEGDPLADLGFTALIDFREWTDFLWHVFGTADADQACALVVGFGLACEACPSDGEELCLRVVGEDLLAVETDLALEARTAGEVEADPTCP